jgi:hypothetical protein
LLGLLPTAISMASGTPRSVADGSPSSPGTNVSQIASSALRALPLISRGCGSCTAYLLSLGAR